MDCIRDTLLLAGQWHISVRTLDAQRTVRRHTHGSHFGGQRWAGVRSDWLSLDPGTTSKEVNLRLSLAAGLRGVVVSEDGKFVPASNIGGTRPDVHLQLDFGPREDFPGNETRSYVGTDNGPWGPNDGRFGFNGLDNRPFRIRVSGWEIDPSEPIQLEPGEMRIVRVTLKQRKSEMSLTNARVSRTSAVKRSPAHVLRQVAMVMR